MSRKFKLHWIWVFSKICQGNSSCIEFEYFRKHVEEIQVALNYDKNNAELCTFMAISRWILLRMKNCSQEIVEKIRTHILCSTNLFFRKSYILWDSMKETGHDNIILRIRFTCCIAKTTDIHSEYVICIAFPQQQWFLETVTHTNTHCLSCRIFYDESNIILTLKQTDASLQNINPSNTELNPICYLLALLGGATIVVVSRLRVNIEKVLKYSISEIDELSS
jgi:hypothetical protein